MAQLFADVTPATNLWNEGLHAFRVGNVEWGQSRSSGADMITLTVYKTDDDNGRKGARKKAYLSFSEKAAPITFKNLLALRPDTDVAYWQTFDFPEENKPDYSERIVALVDELDGIEGVLRIKHKEENGETRDNIVAFLPAGTATGDGGGNGWN